MKNKFFISFALFPAVLLGSAFAVSKGAHAGHAENSINTLNYSKGGNSSLLTGSEALGKILDSQGNSSVISAVEKDYLDATYQFEYSALNSGAKYNVGLLDGYYWIEAFEEENYSPKYVLVDGSETHYEFTRLNKQLIARVPANDVVSIVGAKIIYEQKINVLPDDANKLLTEAFTFGKEESEHIHANEKYAEDLAKYNQYILDYAEYTQYLSNKAAYDLAKANYDKYLQEKAQYDLDLAKYNQYLLDKSIYLNKLAEYNEYIEAVQVYEKNMEAYNKAVEKYNADMEVIDSQLAILDVLFQNFGNLNLSIEYFINTDSVDVVVNKRDDIAMAGVEGAAVDDAKRATEIAKPLINEYKAIKDSSKEEKYAWYQKNYVSLRNSITQLTKCLEYFYTLNVVRSAIEEKERTEKYILFVGELIYFSELLNADEINCYKGNYKVDATRKIGGVASTYPELLGSGLLDVSVVPTPLRTSYPAIPGKPVVPEPEEGIPEPVAPVEVKKPIEPNVVSEPVAPEVVQKPSVVVEPVDPGYVLREEYYTLAMDYDAGGLDERNKVSSYVPITVTDEVVINTTSDVLALFDTRLGVEPQQAKFREFIYFTDPTGVEPKTIVTNPFGVISSNEEAVAVIFADTPSDMLGQSVADIIDSQALVLEQFAITWRHVLYNESGESFGYLNKEDVTTGYELTVPSYEPVHAEDKVDGLTTAIYKFVGYDFTSEVDQTANKLSGLTTTDEIAMHQESSTSAVINVVFERVPVSYVGFEGQERYFVENGTKIVTPSFVPTKPSTVSTIYEFDYWMVNGQKATFPYVVNESVSFTAKFKEIGIYTVEFKVGDEVISSQKVNEGSMPVVPTNIIKENEGNTFFMFDGWDKEVTPVSGNTTYVAKFIQKEIVSGAVTEQKRNIVTVEAEEVNTVSLNDLLHLIAEERISGVDTLNIKLKDAEFSLNASQISFLISVDADSISLVRNVLNNGYYELQFVITNKTGEEIQNNSFALDVIAHNILDTSHARPMVGADEIASTRVDESNLKFTMKLGSKVTIKYFYKVSFDKYLTTGSFTIDGEAVEFGKVYEFERGESVVVDATANPGINLLGVYCVRNNGQKVPFEDNSSIVVSDSDLVFYQDIERIIYSVELVVDNLIYERIQCTYGVLVNLPTNISKPADDTYRYVFTGWDKEVSVVTEDVLVKAIFEQIEINPKKEEEEEPEEGMTLGQKISIGALSACVAVIIGGVVIVVVKTRRKPLKK